MKCCSSGNLDSILQVISSTGFHPISKQEDHMMNLSLEKLTLVTGQRMHGVTVGKDNN